MKTKILLPAVCLSLLLASCSVVNDNNFYSQKYTKFNKNKTEVPDGPMTAMERLGTKEAVASAPVENEFQFQPVAVSETPVVSQQKLVAENRTDEKFRLHPVTENKVTKIPASAKRFFEKKDPVKNMDRKSSSKSWWGFATDAVAVILAIFIPPLGVWYYENGITKNFWIDLILCFCFWIPGIVYALLVVLEVI